jgi:hypothetical protein
LAAQQALHIHFMFAWYSTDDTHEPGVLNCLSSNEVRAWRNEQKEVFDAGDPVAFLLWLWGSLALCHESRAPAFAFPGETMLLIAAIAAGTTHQLDIFWVIVAAARGAILGDN